jgi:hypothetical protein
MKKMVAGLIAFGWLIGLGNAAIAENFTVSEPHHAESDGREGVFRKILSYGFSGNQFHPITVAPVLEVNNQLDSVSTRRAGFYAGGRIGAVQIGGIYFLGAGDAGIDPSRSRALGSPAHEDQPYYIVTGPATSLFNTEVFFGNRGIDPAERPDPLNIGLAVRNADTRSFAIHSLYNLSERLKLHGAISFSKADKELSGRDDDYGWEYNVGAAYRLLGNLIFEAHFGYQDAGDFFRGGDAEAPLEKIYLLSNHLTMTF